MLMKNYTQLLQKHVWCQIQFYIVENIQTIKTIRHAALEMIFYMLFIFIYFTFNASK